MWWRIPLGIFAGVVTGSVIAFGLESLGHMVYPPAAGIDLTNPEHFKTLMGSLPLGAQLFVVFAWAVAGFIGGMIGAWIGRSLAAAIGVALVLVGFGVWTMTEIPHPVWMMVAGVVALTVPAYLGGRISMQKNGAVRNERPSQS
jgi:hypothetical protein